MIKRENNIYYSSHIDEDGVFSNYFFNYNLYRKIIDKRGRKLDNDDKIIEHSLTGKRIRRNGKEYIVQNVYKFWWFGYYLHALLRDDNDSHGGMDFENISCESDYIVKNINENEYEII